MQLNASYIEYNGRNEGKVKEREREKNNVRKKERKRRMPPFADRVTKKKDLYSFFFVSLPTFYCL